MPAKFIKPETAQDIPVKIWLEFDDDGKTVFVKARACHEPIQCILFLKLPNKNNSKIEIVRPNLTSGTSIPKLREAFGLTLTDDKLPPTTDMERGNKRTT